jgi:exopolysaccharide production protein ExoQ
MKGLINTAEKYFVVIALILFSGGPHKVLQLADADQSFEAGSSAIEQLMFLVIHVVSLFFIVVRWKQVFKELLKADRIILFLLFCVLAIVCVSAVWSQYPDITIRRSIALLGTSFFSLYFATRYSFKEQMKLLLTAFGVAVFMSFIFAIALPKYGRMSGQHEGAWRGIYLHKNGLGSTMALSAILFFIAIKADNSRRIVKWTGFIFSFLLILLSTSKSALVSFFGLFVLLHLGMILRWQYELMVPCFLGAIALMSSLGMWLLDNADSLLRAMGKDPTLTGRTDMWPYIVETILARPWFGYGYESFWQGFDSDAAYVWYSIGWEPTHPHNGLLELLLVFGAIGTFTFLLLFFIGLFRSLVMLRLTRNAIYLWPLMFLSYTIFSNIAETKVLEYNNLSWVLFIAAILSRPLSSDIFIKNYKFLQTD